MGSNIKGRGHGVIFFLERLRKPVETYVKVTHLRAENPSQDLLNTKENC
jgi:hypothetical protein